MAAPDPLAGTPEAFGLANWLEAVTSTKIGSDMVSRTSGEAILTARINAVQVRGCQRFCLGWDAVNGSPNSTGGTTYSIQRCNPVFHPRLTNLYCTSAASNEYAPNAGPLILPANAPTNPSAAFFTLGRRANYKKATITLRFEPLPYPLVDDSLLPAGQEWLRNSWIDTEPKTEVLSLDGFQMVYAEGNAAAPFCFSSPVGKVFPGSIGQMLVKPDIRVGWDLVPETFIMTTGTFIPGNILAGLGNVNKTAWQGYPAGTLLMLGAKLTRKPNPLMLLPLAGFTAFEPSFLYSIEFLMSYFNPPKGYDALPPAGPTQLIPANVPQTQIGHNCFPWKGDVAATRGLVGVPCGNDFNSGLWFLATFDGNPPGGGGQTLFGQYEYANLFASPNNTWKP